MNIYRVTITGVDTNSSGRIVRYFATRDAAQAYVDSRHDAPGSVTVIKGLKLRD